jgi:spore coat protein U domain-containing protein, fimbrial subunit CupE1/2/3/6
MKFGIRGMAQAALLLLASACVGQSFAGGCSVTSGGMAFGRYQPLNFAGKLASSDSTSDATISVACTAIVSGGSYSISLGPSAVGNSIMPRYLSHDAGGPGMAFNIYLDATHATVWGDGFTGTVLIGSIPVGDSSQSHTVFGRVPAGQSQLRAGNYSGSLTLTISYNP